MHLYNISCIILVQYLCTICLFYVITLLGCTIYICLFGIIVSDALAMTTNNFQRGPQKANNCTITPYMSDFDRKVKKVFKIAIKSFWKIKQNSMNLVFYKLPMAPYALVRYEIDQLSTDRK